LVAFKFFFRRKAVLQNGKVPRIFDAGYRANGFARAGDRLY